VPALVVLLTLEFLPHRRRLPSRAAVTWLDGPD
jgi:hypothetical protein